MSAIDERPRWLGAEWLQPAAVALALFAVYALSASRTVGLEDDGLFILSSYFLGIEHPPGYPLFTLIGHLFSRLPLGSVAYRVHLASSLFGALTCSLAWLCVRALGFGRLPAVLAAVGLGLSPVFWSQAIIAEVYTLNTFFFLLLMLLGLRACPRDGTPRPEVLPAMALVFGLSLSNHYPLMLLVAPAFVVLLWPLRQRILRRAGLLLWLVVVGLVPYAWMVYRSWKALPISFDGPLETLPEIWFFLSRAGYAGIDQSASSSWLDRIKFFEFEVGQVLWQFAIVGSLVALMGLVVKWRLLGRRLSGFLAVAFFMPSFGLLLLLGFDYDSIHKHVFHVYPLPAYAVLALWMAIGFSCLVGRYAGPAWRWRVAAAGLLVLIFCAGARFNLFDDDEWGARYAQTLLKILPPNAVVFGQGEADLAPLAYFHMIENQRPDLTLYHPKGLVLGNRLFHPLRTSEESAARILREMIDAQKGPVVFTLDYYTGYARRDYWLFNEVDKSSTDPRQVSAAIPTDARPFFERSIAGPSNPNAWIALLQGELRRRYATVLGRNMPRNGPTQPAIRRDVDALGRDFYGALGLAEGLMLNTAGYSVGSVAAYLDRASKLMPSDVTKEHLSRFFYLRGALRASMGDRAGGIADSETALSIWPVAQNSALQSLEKLYLESGNAAAVAELHERAKHLKREQR
jgi:hypothetical protein